MNSKHTPGPWEAHFSVTNERAKLGQWNFFHRDESDHLDLVQIHRVTRNNPQTSADAALIASAPDLLSALKFLLVDIDEVRAAYESQNPAHVGFGQRISAARAAIAKAEGKQ